MGDNFFQLNSLIGGIIVVIIVFILLTFTAIVLYQGDVSYDGCLIIIIMALIFIALIGVIAIFSRDDWYNRDYQSCGDRFSTLFFIALIGLLFLPFWLWIFLVLLMFTLCTIFPERCE